MLTRIEPEEPGFDLQYYCTNCASNETIVAPL